MWIAKNSITGKTYGNKFKSIYDCQSFIDIITDALHSFESCDSMTEFREVVKMSLQGVKQSKIDNYINNCALSKWSKNNIIRCWNVEQNRFATGFDF